MPHTPSTAWSQFPRADHWWHQTQVSVTPFRRLSFSLWQWPRQAVRSVALKTETKTLTMSKLYGNRKRAKAAMALQDVLSNVIHPKAGGIDMGCTEMVVSIPIGLSDGAHIRTFNTFTRGITALRDWLLSCGITTVAIESTGNYWVTTYDILTEAGIDVWLVNARSVNGASGRKTDVCDAQWLQQLHAAGLLKRSHRPEKEIIPMRYLMRHRADLVAQCAQQLQLMQKVMTEMNLHIHYVFSDIDGMSAQAIITAILAAERNPLKLAALQDKRCRSKLSDIVDALNGNYREEYLFVLKQLQQSCRQKQALLVEVDAELAKIIDRIEVKVEGPLLPATPKQKVKNKNEPANMIRSQEAWRFFGVDLSHPGNWKRVSGSVDERNWHSRALSQCV